MTYLCNGSYAQQSILSGSIPSDDFLYTDLKNLAFPAPFPDTLTCSCVPMAFDGSDNSAQERMDALSKAIERIVKGSR